jgi:mannose-6-phosphate isomerase-like protein (cupin superfamily)
MWISKKATSPRYVREEGIVSYLLTSQKTCGSERLTTTFVLIEPGGYQRVHRREPEQAYFILEGTGRMTVGDETEQVGPGDCIFVPTGAPHGLVNDGDEVLKYFSAAAPSFDAEQLERFWPLPGEQEME